jgi:hypothetical protein
LPTVEKFLAFVVDRRLHFTENSEKDAAMSRYLAHMCYVSGHSPTYGSYAMSGWVYLCPEIQHCLPRAWKCLLAWQRSYIGNEGGPEAEEAIGVIMTAMTDLGYPEEARALAVALDGYLRTHDLFQLQVRDVIVTTLAGSSIQEVALKLGVAERGESSKTGPRQGVRIDWPGTAELLKKQVLGKPLSAKLFASNANTYRRAWAEAVALVKSWKGCADFDVGPPHSVRHTGASRDLSLGYRSLWQVQRRGRWSSEKSVLRYAKSHAWIECHSKLPSEVRRLGTEALIFRGERPNNAPE